MSTRTPDGHPDNLIHPGVLGNTDGFGSLALRANERGHLLAGDINFFGHFGTFASNLYFFYHEMTFF
jgi:hypothetical protein